MALKVGSLVYATDQGLGYLAKSFFDAGVVTHPLIVAHGRRPEHPEWFPGAGRLNDLKGSGMRMAEEFCRRMDVMLFFETPFIWPLIDVCRSAGIKTALMPMYECMPKVLPTVPDIFLCPSLLDLQYYEKRALSAGQYAEAWKADHLQSFTDYPAIHDKKCYFTPIPVEDDIRGRWRQRKRAHTFVHNAGHGGLKGRNGSQEFIKAIPLITSPVELIVRSQDDAFKRELYRAFNPVEEKSIGGPFIIARNEKGQHLRYEGTTVPREELYVDGDVFLFPEKFNGLSLPLQEAWASGMLVMATNRFPMNTWLPTEPLIGEADSKWQDSAVSPRCNTFREAIVDPKDIASKIDQWYDADISAQSEQGRQWAEANSWSILKEKYLAVLSK